MSTALDEQGNFPQMERPMLDCLVYYLFGLLHQGLWAILSFPVQCSGPGKTCPLFALAVAEQGGDVNDNQDRR